MVLGISNEHPSVIEQFVANQGVTFPILHDDGGNVYRQYSVWRGQSPYPRDYIVDRDGILQYANNEYDPRIMKIVLDNLVESETGVQSGDDLEAPEDFILEQNYPNPFNGRTNIFYKLAKKAKVRLVVYTVSGQLVRDLVTGTQDAGPHTATWDGTDAQGTPVPSAVYLYKLEIGGSSIVKKMSYIR